MRATAATGKRSTLRSGPAEESGSRSGPAGSGQQTASAELGDLQIGSVETRGIVRRAAPRLLRDGVGPLAVFFAGWKLVGLSVGIGSAVAFGAAVFVHERRAGRPAMVVRLALVLVAIRATVGLLSDSATAYLGFEIAIDTVLGLLVLATLASPRPFTSWFADEVFPLPVQVRESDTFLTTMRTLTLVWGVYFLARALVRLSALLTLGTDRYVLVSALTDAPFLIALLAWSVHYTTSTFRRHPVWGPLLVD
jgi:intracellular septation protein A